VNNHITGWFLGSYSVIVFYSKFVSEGVTLRVRFREVLFYHSSTLDVWKLTHL
jgi:hypothetical protein